MTDKIHVYSAREASGCPLMIKTLKPTTPLILAIVSLFLGSSSQPHYCLANDRFLAQGKTDSLSGSFLGPLKSDFMTPDQLGLQHEEVYIANENGVNLRLWMIPATGGKQTVLLCMGNQGNISTHLAYARLLVDGGFNVLMFDYQGFGKSTGDASVLTLYSDTCRVAEFLISEKKLVPADIGCFGVSLGSALAVSVAAKYQFGAVAIEDTLLPKKMLDQAAQYLPNDFASKIALGTVRNVILPQVDPLTTAKKLNCPILIMHGENDPLLPPAGSIELAGVVTKPKRVWLMEGAGHAPETLEIFDGEYGNQLTTFFKQAFGSGLTEPQVAMKVTPKDQQWQIDVEIDCDEEGCYQVVVADKNGTCHFAKQVIKSKATISEMLTFEPSHVSAVRIQNAKPIDEKSWVATLTERSQSLKNYRNFEARFKTERPEKSKLAISYGMLRQLRYREPSDLEWLTENLPEVTEVHPSVRPRYARFAASVFCGLLVHEQETSVEFIAEILPFMPADPYEYYQLENAGYQLQLRDEGLVATLILLAKHRYDQGQLEASKQLLQMASKTTRTNWPTANGIEQLKLGQNFYLSIGSPYK
jgi:hypothetical protein